MPTQLNTEPDINRINPAEVKRQIIGGRPVISPSDIPFFPGGEPSPGALIGITRRIRQEGLDTSRPGQIPTAGGVFLPTVNVPAPITKPTPRVTVTPPEVTIDAPLGEPVVIKAPGVSATLPVTRTISGRLALLLPKLQRASVRVGMGQIDIIDWCRTFGLTRAECGWNALLNIVIQAATKVRLPAGTVTFFPGKFPVKTTPVRRTAPPPVFVPLQPRTAPGSPVVPGKPGIIPAAPPMPKVTPSTPPDVSPGKLPPSVAPRPQVLPKISDFPLKLPSNLPSPARTAPAPAPAITPKVVAPPKRTPWELGLLVLPGLLSARSRTPRVAAIGTQLADLVGSTSPIGQATPFVSRFAAPAASPFAQRSRARTSDADCVEVDRARKRNRCYEGFFEQLPGRTRYTRWREVNCVTRKTIRSLR